jgi:hypothetical protein
MENRRSFVKKVSLSSFILSPTVSFLAKALGISEVDSNKLISFQFHLFRPKDLLDFEYSFIGAIPNKDTFSKIKYLKPSGKPASFMIVRIAQQHVSELFYYLDQNHYDDEFISKVKNAIAKSFVSGYSFLVFKIDFDKIGNKLKFNSENLLCWNADYFELVTGIEVSTQVVNPNYPLVIKDNFPFQKSENIPITTFELPYKLYLTPFPDKFIFSSNKLREKGNTVELWWNQIKSPLRKSGHPTFKVIGWENNASGTREDNTKEDYATGEKYLPTEDDREHLTKQFLRKDGHEAETLDFRISSLGAITKIRYYEDEKLYRPSEDDRVEWKQDINLGRDNYVKIVTLGVIMPFGHKCKHIRIGERKIKDGVSFVEYKEFIEPLEFEKSCFLSKNSSNPNEPGVPQKIIDKGDNLKKEQLRNTPFKAIRIITKISPPIIPVNDLTNEVVVDFIDKTKDSRNTADPDQNTAGFKGRRGAFWAKIRNDVKTGVSPIEELLNFNYVGIDWNDNEIHFKAPFIFARDILFTSGAVDIVGKGLADVKTEYDKAENKIRREIDIAGQKIAFYKLEFKKVFEDITEPIKSKLSEFETNVIQFVSTSAVALGSKFENEFPFYPQLEMAYANLPVLKEIIKDPRGVVIKYATPYINQGVELVAQNAEGILLDVKQEIISTAGTISYQPIQNIFNNVSDKLAGVANPDIIISVLSLYQNAYCVNENYIKPAIETIDGIRQIKGNIKQTAITLLKSQIANAKILGHIAISDIISNLESKLHIDKLPIQEFKELYNSAKELEKIQITYTWSSGRELFEDTPLGIVHFYNINKSNSTNTDLSIYFNQEINIKSPSNTKFTSETKLNNFGIGIEISGSKLISLFFDNIKFTCRFLSC